MKNVDSITQSNQCKNFYTYHCMVCKMSGKGLTRIFLRNWFLEPADMVCVLPTMEDLFIFGTRSVTRMKRVDFKKEPMAPVSATSSWLMQEFTGITKSQRESVTDQH